MLIIEEERKDKVKEQLKSKQAKIDQKKAEKQQLMGLFRQDSISSQMAGKFKDMLEDQKKNISYKDLEVITEVHTRVEPRAKINSPNVVVKKS